MDDASFAEVIETLDELLDDERDALLEGNLDQVSRLVARKETLIERLAQVDRTDRGAILELNVKFERNQALLRSALEGIRSVTRRLAMLRRVRTSLDTYDSRGARRSIEMSPETSVEKRA